MRSDVRRLNMNLDKGGKWFYLSKPSYCVVLPIIVYGKNEMEKIFGNNEEAGKGN